MINHKLVNYDILHDEHDIALLFNSDVDLNDASLMIKGDGYFSLIYKNRAYRDLVQCPPELWPRISKSNSIMCCIMSADKNQPPKYYEIPILR
jgi:hypothetical protein